MSDRITTLTMLGLFANLADEIDFVFLNPAVPIEKRVKMELLGERIRTITATAFIKWEFNVTRDDLIKANDIAIQMRELSVSLDNKVSWNKFIIAIIKITKDFHSKATNEQIHTMSRALLMNAQSALDFFTKNDIGDKVCENAFNLIETFDRIIRAGKRKDRRKK